MSGGERKLLGRWGEAQVARWLKERGYRLLDANWSCRFGEIDLIAETDKYICFTEVKLRKDAKFAQAREFVDRRKQEKLKITASMYLAAHPTVLQPRFDVAEVYAPQGMESEKPDIIYLEGAF